MTYVNLHAHSNYSTLDGHALIPEYVKRAEELNHTHVALTDHGTLGGVPKLWKSCTDVTPIAGIEIYTTPATRPQKGHRAPTITSSDTPRDESARL